MLERSSTVPYELADRIQDRIAETTKTSFHCQVKVLMFQGQMSAFRRTTVNRNRVFFFSLGAFRQHATLACSSAIRQ